MYNIKLTTATLEEGTRQALLDALTRIGESTDNDFSGANGPQYMQDQVWKENGFENYEEWREKGEPKLLYESNLKYAIAVVRDIESDEECIKTFFDDWLAYDPYYSSYKWEVITNASNEIVAIALAIMYKA